MTKTKRWATDRLLLLPAALVFVGIFTAPMIYLVIISFWEMDLFRLRPAATLGNYVDTFAIHGGAMVRTVALSSVVAVLCTCLGFATAYIIRFGNARYANFLLFVVLITLFGGYLTKIYAWKTILGTEGVINTALLEAGLIRSPIQSLLYSPGAVIVSLVHFLLPFAVLPLYGALRGIRDVELEAARDLGASFLSTFMTIILPRVRWALIVAFVFCFFLASGDYITPILVGGGTINLFGQMIAPQFGTMFNWPLGAAMGMSLVLVAMMVAGLAAIAIERVLRP